MPYLYDADDDVQDGPPTELEPLRELIVAQGMQETGIFVLLFTSETVAATGTAAEVGRSQAVDLVEGKAGELGIDPVSLTLFSDDAYLLQAALGEAAAPENA